MTKNAPNFVTSCSSHIPYPLHTAIVALLKDLEIPDQQSATREHEKAERETERRPAPSLLMCHAGERCLGREHVLASTRETGDLPDNVVVFGFVFGAALTGAFGGFGCVERRRDANDDVRREEFRAIVRLDGDAVFDLRRTHFPHDGMHLEREVYVLRRAVSHELELAVRRNERDDAVCVEPAQFHALVELTVLKCDGARRGASSLRCHAPLTGL